MMHAHHFERSVMRERWGGDMRSGGVGHTSCTGRARVASGAQQQARGPHRDIKHDSAVRLAYL
jgi:hypothetical protein